jgi:SAM-dependent methyltransferase
MNSKIISGLNEYYSEKVLKYGATPNGVDWNNITSQELRFKELLKLIGDDHKSLCSLLDYGCGYGSLFQYLKKYNKNVNYFGYDISEEMLKKAKELFNCNDNWLHILDSNFKADYVVASGLLNVKLQVGISEWEKYVLSTIDSLNRISVKGFAFNILSSYSDKDKMKDYLYYASPEYLFSHCKKNYSNKVSLIHDYELYEFTLLIRK